LVLFYCKSATEIKIAVLAYCDKASAASVWHSNAASAGHVNANKLVKLDSIYMITGLCIPVQVACIDGCSRADKQEQKN
jgi:hypothetical protein